MPSKQGKEEKNFANVNIVLKVCFGEKKLGVEKTPLFLCRVHRKKSPQMGEMPRAGKGKGTTCLVN